MSLRQYLTSRVFFAQILTAVAIIAAFLTGRLTGRLEEREVATHRRISAGRGHCDRALHQRIAAKLDIDLADNRKLDLLVDQEFHRGRARGAAIAAGAGYADVTLI